MLNCTGGQAGHEPCMTHCLPVWPGPPSADFTHYQHKSSSSLARVPRTQRNNSFSDMNNLSEGLLATEESFVGIGITFAQI